MKFFKFENTQTLLRSNKFLTFACVYAFFALFCLLLLVRVYWLPPGFALAGHDSGLPLDAKQFLLSRLYAWDDRLGFGLDNSANFGSLTIHFFDWISSVIAGTPYAGNYVSLFFWLGLIFLSAFIFAYQLKSVCGKPFVFILPVFLTFNFYVFQSVFMLERAKFGIFSATLLSLAVFFRMQEKKFSVITSAVLTSFIFSVFNGGGWFGITLYGGVAVILISLILYDLIQGIVNRNLDKLRRTLIFIVLTMIFYIFLNFYSILPYSQNFISNDAPRLLRESTMEAHISWLRYVSRSTSLINLFRLFGVPDWYSEPNEINQTNVLHPYAPLYLDNKILVGLSFIFPILSFASFLLAKTKKQKQILSIFGLITLIEIVFAAGSNSPFGFFYEFLMNNVPGFILLRSAFYKFGIFYGLGVLVLFSFSISILIERLIEKVPNVYGWFRSIFLYSLTFSILCLWLGYHFVLLDPTKIFAWKSDQTTKLQVPSYIYDFEKFAVENNLGEKRVLILPPVNKDWENDAYDWGYWSLSPLPFTLSSARTFSNWHGLTLEELNLVDNLYNAIRTNDEKSFYDQALSLNIGYILLRNDVLIDSKWSASEKPDSYKAVIESFKNVSKIKTFGRWEFYQLNETTPMQVFTASSINITADNFISLANKFLSEGYTVGMSDKKKYPEIDDISLNKVYAYDCLSCLLEKQVRLKSLPETVVLPGSLFYRFKEAREQKVISQPQDSRSKIANFLGFVLTRTAEQKKMLDLSVKEERVLNNAGVIRMYLGQLNLEIESSKNYSNDFELLSQILDFLSPVERAVSDYMKTNISKSHSHRFDEEMLGILWDIGKIKDYFSSLLDNRERWSNEKVYKLTFPETGNYNLAFSSNAFPKTLGGEIILPKQIRFTKGSEEKIIKVSESKENWLSADLGYQDKGDGKLVLYFDELPGLFSVDETRVEKFPFGNVACINGQIKNFDRKRAYEILISRTDRLRTATAILRDKSRSYSEQHSFLKGEDLFEVPAVASGEFSRYIYFPSSYASNISLYICSDDKIIPSIEKIVVREFFSPSVLIVNKSDLVVQSPPSLNYTRINPTSYFGDINDSNYPFILVFDEKLNHLWKLSTSSRNGNWETNNKHFMVDGYANGWLIEKGSERKFKIEYTPQTMFVIGVVVSICVLTFCISWLVYSFVKMIRRK